MVGLSRDRRKTCFLTYKYINKGDPVEGSHALKADHQSKAVRNGTLASKVKADNKREERENDLEGNFKVVRRRKPQACEPSFKRSMFSAGLKRKFAHLFASERD